MKEPVELCLCEKEHLVLKPDVLYVFRVIEGCADCARLAAEAQS